MALMLELEREQDTEVVTTHAGRVITEHRIAAGRTMRSVAEPCGITVAHLCHIERGRRTAPVKTLVKIYRELGINKYVMYNAFMKDSAAAARLSWLDNQPS